MASPVTDLGALRSPMLLSGALRTRVEQARDTAVAALLRERTPGAGWVGELSASALSTATAVTALTLVAHANAAAAERLRPYIVRGYQWLIAHQNADGGWGDTTRSYSNISTTVLVWAALGLHRDDTNEGKAARSSTERLPNDNGGLATQAFAEPSAFAKPTADRTAGRPSASPTGLRCGAIDGAALAQSAGAAERWLEEAAGSLEPRVLVRAIEQRYGKDRTFSIPILTMCALCGRLGPAREGWKHVRQLPFELAALPQRWFGALQLPVVSYALPALIAIGQVRHRLRPTANPIWRRLRDHCVAPTLAKLNALQPGNGGFLEATPLTSFVTMSLVAAGEGAHPVVQRGVAFIEASIRPDGSWPIDTNLATWVTTLSVNALAPFSNESVVPPDVRCDIRDWLSRQQFRNEHPYTLAAPGGWAWTDLPGGVPDADDTAGAILALRHLGLENEAQRESVRAGMEWLMNLQNRDGGIPTFCRGWGRLPFDRSSPDISAHALRAWNAGRSCVPFPEQAKLDVATSRAVTFLKNNQRADGAWVPLWFGHQDDAGDENPLYGTARVVPALCELEKGGRTDVGAALSRAVHWLTSVQNADGGWSGATGTTSTVEETGLALEAMAAAWERTAVDEKERTAMTAAIERGAVWLADAIAAQHWREPAPIGFYFAKLWYYERLYPLVFATGALVRLAATTSYTPPPDQRPDARQIRV